MKHNQLVERKSRFWPRLLGALIAVAIGAVMVTGGVKNLMGELSTVHEALAASQSELAVTHYELDAVRSKLVTARSELTGTQSELAGAQVEVASKALALQQSAQLIDAANNRILALSNSREQLKLRWGNTLRALEQRNEQFLAADKELRAVQGELEQLRQQPKLSMIVTTERQMLMSQRERFAASHVRMFVESDAGTMFYDGQEALHEIEKYTSYSERTQVVYTQTAPGQDVLECLNEADRRRRRGCGTIVAARVHAVQMQAYSYQSQYSSMQSLLWME